MSNAAAECVVDECRTPVGRSGAQGMCPKHYVRWRKHGDPLVIAKPGPKLGSHRIGYSIQTAAEERFWAKVDKNGPIPIERPELGACWRWTAGITTEGYAAFNFYKADGQRTRDSAHAWAYRRYVGPIPDGHQLDHLCRTVDIQHCSLGDLCPHRACVNYERHLQPTTPAQNTMRSRSWAATKKRQITCHRGHLLISPNLLVSRLPHRACKACAATYPVARQYSGDPNFNFQAESDLTYNRIMGISPEQTRHQRYEPATIEALREVEIMIRNLEKL